MSNNDRPYWRPLKYANDLAVEAEGDVIEELIGQHEAGLGLSLAEQLFLLQYAPLSTDEAADLRADVEASLGLDIYGDALDAAFGPPPRDDGDAAGF